MKKHYLYLLSIGILVAMSPLKAQVLPVGTPLLDDYYRRLQLLGQLDSTISFNVRPLNNAALQQDNIYDPQGTQSRSKSIVYTPNGEGMFQLMPIEWQHQINSNFPYGWNDEGMIPARGYQTKLSAGFFAQYKFLSVQFRPQFIFAQNSAFQGFEGSDINHWSKWYRFMNAIDAPERFGTGNYTRFFPGQSSIRLNFHPISVGLSTENLWWGPGMHNSLLMSNNAPGFLHATINTTRPITTPIGSFEGQLVGGKLEASGFTPTPLGNPAHYDNLYRPKPDDWRYFSGIVLSYQPKWIPGLSVGLIRAFTVYRKDMGNSLGDYLPFFSSATKAGLQNPDEEGEQQGATGQNQLASVFVRWAIPSAQFEIYGEYGRDDHPWNSRDLMVNPNHARAYIFGLRKIVPLHTFENDMVQVAFELTQLEPSKNTDLRPFGNWYTHSGARDGYTQLGQILGAGVGLGNNVQTLQVSWLRGMKQLGFQIERLVHNNALFYNLIADKRRNWVDLNIGAYGEYDYKNFIFNARLMGTKAFNYQYQIGDASSEWKYGKVDRYNLHLQLGMQYRF